jgi:sugar/nucleoside kinase (ribokinase family)
MPFEVQRALVESLADTEAFVSVDPHLPVTEETLPAWRNMLANADAFFPGEDEWLLGSDADARAVLPRLAIGRLRFVVLTRGARGGILYDAREGRFQSWSARTDRVVDQTGAGDAFALGVVTAHLDRLSVDEMLRRGRVTASFALEAWGPEGLLRATVSAAKDRQREWDGDEAPA